LSLEDKNIDQLFKDKLASQNFEVPASFLSDLEGQLDAMAPTKKKKAGFYWWFLGLIPLFLIAYISYSTFYKGELLDHDNNQSNNQTSKDFEKNTSSVQLITQNNATKNTSIDLNTQNIDQTNKGDNSKTSFADSLDSENNLNKINFNNPNSNNAGANYLESKNENHSTPISNKNSLNTSSSGSKKNGTSNITFGNNNNNNKPIGNNPGLKETNETGTDKSNDFSTPISISSPNITDSIVPIANVVSDSSIDLSLTTQTFIDTIKKIIFVDSVVIRDSVVIVYDTITILDSSHLNVTKNFRVESQLLFGTGLVKSLGSPRLMENSDLLSKSKIRTYDVGFDLNFYWKKASLSTGFSRYNWGDYFKYTNLKVSQHDSIIIDHYDETIIIDTNTSQIDTIYTAVMDTINIIDSTLNNNTFVAYYSRLSIPLKFGYKFDYKTWSIIPRVGINFEIRSRKEDDGIYIPGNFTNNIPKRTSLSYMMQVEIRKNFNKRYVYLSPFYRKTSTNLFDGNVGVGKYEVYGLHFGIGSKF